MFVVPESSIVFVFLFHSFVNEVRTKNGKIIFQFDPTIQLF